MSDGWERAIPPLALGMDEVHVWQARLDQPPAIIASLTAVLSVEERAQSQRFRFEHDQRRYTVAHGFMREVLGAYCRTPSSALRFGTNRFGKPYLLQPHGTLALRFNLSHSGDLALVALAIGREVGVDIEAMRPLDDAGLIAQHFFSFTERSTLFALPSEHKEQAFYTCWSRKEAFIKVLGMGLAMPLDKFDVTLAPNLPAQLIRIAGQQHTTPRWSLHDLPPIPGYAAALAIRGANQRILCKFWSPDAM